MRQPSKRPPEFRSPAHHSNVPSFHFRPLREDDLTLLREWLLRPHVAAWWGPADSIDELRGDYLLSVDQPNATRADIAHMDGKPIGFIQAYVVMGGGGGWWESETDPGARGIDQFLAEADQLGRGLGRAMIRAFVDQLFADPAVTLVQTDPDPRNERAIRCYAAAGFYPVGGCHHSRLAGVTHALHPAISVEERVSAYCSSLKHRHEVLAIF
jgi:aminoglycoside 6'-N-acetyltransferase Ib